MTFQVTFGHEMYQLDSAQMWMWEQTEQIILTKRTRKRLELLVEWGLLNSGIRITNFKRRKTDNEDKDD